MLCLDFLWYSYWMGPFLIFLFRYFAAVEVKLIDGIPILHFISNFETIKGFFPSILTINDFMVIPDVYVPK